jgi:hypothetical protein
MMKRLIITITAIITAICFLGINGYGQQSLGDLIEQGKWDKVASLFLDDSYKVINKYFSAGQSIKISTTSPKVLAYKVKFITQGEMGTITLEEKNGKFLNARIRNQVRPLYYIEKFKKFKASNLQLTVGNARFHFVEGHFYQALPFNSLLVFKGRWSFYIKPADREERLTLERLYKKDSFTRTKQTGIFLLTDRSFLSKLPAMEEVPQLDPVSQELYDLYRAAYGIQVNQYNETWFLPFPESTNLAFFNKEKDKNGFYYYSYNPNLTPDTQLAETGDNRLILSYNKEKGMRLTFSAPERVSELNLNIFLNPESRYISGTTTINYSNPSNLRILQLSPGLKLAGNLDPEGKGLNVFRKKDKYYLMGSESKSISLYFNGYVKPSAGTDRALKDRDNNDKKTGQDIFYFLSKTENYYPNPGSEFFKTNVTVTVPRDFNCLVTGNLEQKKTGDANVFQYSSKSSKGISLAAGNFKLAQKLNTKTPIHFYLPTSVPFPKTLDLQELKEATNLFLKSFGPIDLSTINIMLKEGEREGGLSNNGFITINMQLQKRRPLPLDGGTGPRLDPKTMSPIILRDRTEDHILHELSHQWWGGIISWKSYQDVWITEGLAHFSVLYFLKKHLSERRFNRIIRKLKRWVFRFSDTGPIIYGNRIHMLENNYEAFQSVIYNKSALMFLMLADLLGEKDFFHRLNSVTKKFKYKSISSAQFIRQFSHKNKMLEKFFKKWIYTRAIPTVELKLEKEHKKFDHDDFKTVVFSINQLDKGKDNGDNDFVMPLNLKVTTLKGSSIEQVVLKEPSQLFVISRKSTIRSIDLQDGVAPVKEKKPPNGSSYR